MPRDRKIRTNWGEDASRFVPGQVTLPLTSEEVASAARYWATPKRNSQWSAIETIAQDIWATPEAEAERLRRLWVTLTYAVGNFKRQGGTNIVPFPAEWALARLPGTAAPGASLSIPINGTAITLHRDGTTSDFRKRGMRGLASAPTGSTLLSALWPDEHAIMDMRDFQSAVGLLASQGADVVALGETRSLLPPDWSEYRWFRRLVKDETIRLGLASPSVLERALFVAYRFGPENAAGMTWAEWGAALKAGWC